MGDDCGTLCGQVSLSNIEAHMIVDIPYILHRELIVQLEFLNLTWPYKQ